MVLILIVYSNSIFFLRSLQKVKDELFPKFQTGESKSDNVIDDASGETLFGDICYNKIERFYFVDIRFMKIPLNELLRVGVR